MRAKPVLPLVGVLVSVLLWLPVPVFAAVQLKPVASGLSSPVFVGSAGDGSKRLFIVEQGGVIKVLQRGASTPTVFLDIHTKVLFSGERGLLGLAFHPSYTSNRRFFVFYTRVGDGALVIAEYKVSATNRDVADTAETVFLTIDHPTNANHNGGMLAFGPSDHYLYIGVGDGGAANDPPNNAQNINVLLGKILRINVDQPGNGTPYSAPPDNPYMNVAGRDEIFAIGWRNPWRFSFDRFTHQQWVADVGQGAREEVDTPVIKGGNYGWRAYEGSQCTNNDPTLCSPANYIFPIFDYTHDGGRCSITGGYVYRGTQRAVPSGNYVFGDYCSGEIFTWDGATRRVALETTLNISSFGEDESGELYVVGLGGTISKIESTVVGTDTGVALDFDGDGSADIGVYRHASGQWFIEQSSGGLLSPTWGAPVLGDMPVPADYDGDGKADIAVFRPSSGQWFILGSQASALLQVNWGAGSLGDVPVPADYDGDGLTDLAVYRTTTGQWFILRSHTNTVLQATWGAFSFGDVPIPADYDGDGRADLGIYRTSTSQWFILLSQSNSLMQVNWGSPSLGDVPVPGDYDGDGLTDVGVYRATTGQWFISLSSGGVTTLGWGAPALGDVPVPADYDGDGKTDVGIFRTTTNEWFIRRSSDGSILHQTLGSPSLGDAPLGYR